MKRQYRICNLNITVEAPFFFADNEWWRMFETADVERADIYYHVMYSGMIPEEDDAQGRFFRVFNMGTAPAYAFAFDPDDCRDIYLYIKKDAASVLMDMRFMWDTLRLCDILLYHNVLVVHSSLIDTPLGGIAFCAPSGVGKSTQARLWQTYRGAETINGDKSAFVCAGENVTFSSVPFCGTSGIIKNKNTAARAAVFLSQSSENTVERVCAGEIFRLLSRDTIADTAVTQFGRKAVELIMNIAGKLSFYSMGCTPDERAVIALENALSGEADG